MQPDFRDCCKIWIFRNYGKDVLDIRTVYCLNMPFCNSPFLYTIYSRMYPARGRGKRFCCRNAGMVCKMITNFIKCIWRRWRSILTGIWVHDNCYILCAVIFNLLIVPGGEKPHLTRESSIEIKGSRGRFRIYFDCNCNCEKLHEKRG